MAVVMAMSVIWLTTLVHTNISEKELDGLRRIFFWFVFCFCFSRIYGSPEDKAR